MKPIRPLLSAWPRLAKRMRAAPRRVLLTDFDGTLVRIRRLPGDVRLSKATRRLLVQIRDAGGTVGVVSGRGIEDLTRLVQIPAIWYVGSHGYRLLDPRGRAFLLATPAEQRRVQRAANWLRPRLARMNGIKLDVKRASVAVHYRAASPRTAGKAEAIVRGLLECEPGLRLLHGKKVWELLPGASVDKWTAVERLLAQEKVPEGYFAAYLGDDRTDESVFRGLQNGISAVVGRRSNTAARYWLQSTGEVREFLRLWLNVEREEAGDQ
ncbi:MAG TPA: trehalose-phosphatase [Patescibacteria group bacterium]|nr:trehalose-phosphatase [Patescibacteria group bacterium]